MIGSNYTLLLLRFIFWTCVSLDIPISRTHFVLWYVSILMDKLIVSVMLCCCLFVEDTSKTCYCSSILFTCICVFVWMMYVCVFACLCICMSVHLCLIVCVCVCVHICVYLCVRAPVLYYCVCAHLSVSICMSV